MATTVYGRMQPFIPEKETISAYLERLSLYLEANGIAEEKKVPILLTVYTLLRGLVAPTLPKDKTYAELKQVLKGHFEPKAVVIAERFRFYRRNQEAEETIAEFVATLRKLAAECKFENFLEQALRDRLV